MKSSLDAPCGINIRELQMFSMVDIEHPCRFSGTVFDNPFNYFNIFIFFLIFVDPSSAAGWPPSVASSRFVIDVCRTADVIGFAETGKVKRCYFIF